MSVLAFASSGCGNWLDVNDNPNYPTDVEKSSLLPTVEMRLAEKVGYDIAMVGSFWSQYIVQYSSSNQYYTVMTNNLRNSSSWFRRQRQKPRRCSHAAANLISALADIFPTAATDSTRYPD